MMLLIHLLLFLPCRSIHLSFGKKPYVIGPLGLTFISEQRKSSIEMKNCNGKPLAHLCFDLEEQRSTGSIRSSALSFT